MEIKTICGIKTIDDFFESIERELIEKFHWDEVPDGMLESYNMLCLHLAQAKALKLNLSSITDSVTQPDAKIMQHDNQWISVKDKLPEEGKGLILYCEIDGFKVLGWFHNKKFRCMGINSLGSWGGQTLERVSHWMLFPAPPEADND